MVQDLEAEVQEAKDVSAAYYEKLQQGAQYVQYLQAQAEVHNWITSGCLSLRVEGRAYSAYVAFCPSKYFYAHFII